MPPDDSASVALLTPSTPLDAYRHDVRELAPDPQSSATLGLWLAVVVMLRRYSECESSERSQVGVELLRALGETNPTLIGTAVRALAESAEEAGALHLAFEMLLINEEIHANDVLERGRSLSQRARIARKASNWEISETLYGQVESLGKVGRLPELRARAYLGYAVVAHVRGAYPDARKWYARACRIADANGIAEVSSLAHHGLMIAAGIAGQLENALVEGWAAFRFAADPNREAEMLTCVGHVLLEGGHADAALAAFGAAVQRGSLPRLTLPAWGGLAIAASRVHQVRLVDRAATEIAGIAQRQNLPYPTVSALFDLAVAYDAAGRPTAAEGYRQHVLQNAKRHGFHEFVYRAESLGDAMAAAAARAPHPFTSVGLDVLAELELLGGREALAGRP